MIKNIIIAALSCVIIIASTVASLAYLYNKKETSQNNRLLQIENAILLKHPELRQRVPIVKAPVEVSEEATTED